MDLRKREGKGERERERKGRREWEGVEGGVRWRGGKGGRGLVRGRGVCSVKLRG